MLREIYRRDLVVYIWVLNTDTLPTTTRAAPAKKVLLHGNKVYLSLYHGGALRAQRAYGLEHVHHALVLHALQHRGQRDEHAGAPHAGAATNHTLHDV